jgi:hypothetical protein
MEDTVNSPVKHPAPERRKISWLRQLIGLFGAPTSWAAQMSLSEILTSYACYPHSEPLSAPLIPWLHPALATISLICFIATFFSARIAWTSWRRSRHEAKGGKSHTMEIGEGRTRFLALLSAFSSGLFLIAILFTAFAILLVSPCLKWF